MQDLMRILPDCDVLVINVRANGEQFVCRPEGYDTSFFFRFANFASSVFVDKLIRRRLGLDADARIRFRLV